MAKWLIIIGLSIAGIGAVVWLVQRTGIPLGHLPGDIHIQRDGGSFHFPWVTSIVVSIVLTVLVNVVIRLLR